ncbi:MAG: hypothetical protein JST54_30025 [Deltaproteobacteria bacterium]|nr:hypothetical protein [Deltaproteobacteria bacterium]
MHTWMKLAVMLVLVGTSAVASAKGASKGVRIKNGDRYDKSKDFSLHFDQEIRAQRGHPTDADDARPTRHKRVRSTR